MPKPEAALPAAILEHIRAGKPVRTDPDAPFAGRCGGAMTRRSPGDTFCSRMAGSGTDHKHVGRCFSHPDLETGLPPWVGTLPAAALAKISGTAGRQRTHGATELVTEGKNIDELFEQLLDRYDAAIYRAVPNDPIKLLDTVIRMQMVALGRIQQWQRHISMDYAGRGQRVPPEMFAGPEALATKISATIARLQEQRTKYIEVDKKGDLNEGLLALMQRLSDAEFLALSTNPALLADFAQRAGS